MKLTAYFFIFVSIATLPFTIEVCAHELLSHVTCIFNLTATLVFSYLCPKSLYHLNKKLGMLMKMYLSTMDVQIISDGEYCQFYYSHLSESTSYYVRIVFSFPMNPGPMDLFCRLIQ